MIEQSIQELIQYGIEKELITSEDEIFLRNQLMDLLQLSAWEMPALPEVLPTIDEILDKLVSYAAEKASSPTLTPPEICLTPASWGC